jgi:hypothetical protein
METSLARQAPQRSAFVNISLRVTIQFQQTRLLAPIPSIGQDDKYLPLILFQSKNRILDREGLVNDFVLILRFSRFLSAHPSRAAKDTRQKDRNHSGQKDAIEFPCPSNRGDGRAKVTHLVQVQQIGPD